MRLYVLGPAFGLPSVDAQCIAAVALVKRRIAEEDWSLVPTHEQEQQLPYLEDGNVRLEGFRNIARYLDQQDERGEKQGMEKKKKRDGDTSHLSIDGTTHAQTRMSFYLDDEEVEQESRATSVEVRRANSTAISTFITTHAQTLLDISLYVSADNYSTTRSAFTKILPWHTNYMLPPARRKAARLRTDHLGISSIDVEDVHDDLSEKPPGLAQDVGKEQKDFEPETQKRASMLLGGRETVRSLLRRPEHSAVFKLHALADNFFGPLQDMLGDKTFLLGTDEPTAVDCLAYGYLSLMRYPDLSQDWLAKVLARKYGRLLEYLERLHLQLAVATEAGDVMALSACKNEADTANLRKVSGMHLPWERPARSSPLDVAWTIIDDLLARLPLLRSPTSIVHSNLQPVPAWRIHLPLALTMAATSMGLSLYYAFSTGVLVWPHGQEVHIFGKRRLADYGHLGAALAGVSLLGQQAQGDRAFHQGPQKRSVGDVEVQTEVEGVGMGRVGVA